MQVEVEDNKWCSWCFQSGSHYLIEQKYLERNTYRCAYCCNDTKCCTICDDAMSRVTVDGADKLCMKCDGTLEEWGEYPEFVEQKGHCSWCFKDTIHLLNKYNFVRRSVYLCSECKHRTLKCRSCEKDFARGYVSYDDENCFACNGHIPDWVDPEYNANSLTIKAWCSWCASHCDQVVEEFNTMRRNVHTCTSCDSRTLLCFTCKIAMTRGSGWDSDCCLVCSNHKNVLEKMGHGLFNFSKTKTDDGHDPHLQEEWEKLAKKKEEFSAKYDDPNFVRSELKRESEYRKHAIERGLIRPFLLLVGMTPELRNQVSNFLGWSIFTEKYFGDSHAESWDILTHTGKGMMSRSNSVIQKVNPLSNNNSYYEMMHSVMGAVFKFVPLPSLNHHDAFQASNVSGHESHEHASSVHLDTEHNSVTTDREAALEASDSFLPGSDIRKDQQGEVKQDETNTKDTSKNTLAIAQLEEFLMAQVHSQQRKAMTRAQREQEDKIKAAEESAYKTAVGLMREKAGLSNKDAIMYGVGVARQMLKVPGKWGLTLMSMQALQTALPSTAVFMGPAIAGLTVIMGPLAIIGLAKLLWSGVNFALGPTLWSLYGPLVLMINQRIVLSLQDMQVENFY